jgi:hypothetical protein
MRKKLLLSLVVLLVGGAARASDPVGIYALIERVVVEPSVGAPERIQVWGVFALAQPGTADSYSPPTRGYMYFTLAPGKEDVCRKEWTDLKKVAGTKQCVAFARRYKPTGAVRSVKDPVKKADVYPLGFGLTKVPANNSVAKKLLAVEAPPKGKDKAPK